MEQGQRPQTTGMPMNPLRGGSNVGAWVTLHLHFPSGQERQVLGWLVGSEAGQYKLTKLVTEQETNDGVRPGFKRVIHDGVWLVNPFHVWMVEHEQEAPTPGFRPMGY